MGCLDFILYPK